MILPPSICENPQLPLLMTAAVSTRGMKGACYDDNEREEMYIDALTYYLEHLPDRLIIFAENSGWELNRISTRLKQDELHRVEFLSLPTEQFDISRGKGYNEMLLIALAVQQSEAIKKSGAFFKVTGRYPIYNLGYFMRKAEIALFDKGMGLYCDIKDHKLYDMLRLGWNGHSFDCRLFGVTVPFFEQYMAPLYNKCNDYKDGYLLEDVLFNMVKQCGEPKVVRFSREPHFGGKEGSLLNAISFTQQQDSLKGKLKRVLGNAIRIGVPWFKF